MDKIKKYEAGAAISFISGSVLFSLENIISNVNYMIGSAISYIGGAAALALGTYYLGKEVGYYIKHAIY